VAGQTTQTDRGREIVVSLQGSVVRDTWLVDESEEPRSLAVAENVTLMFTGTSYICKRQFLQPKLMVSNYGLNDVVAACLRIVRASSSGPGVISGSSSCQQPVARLISSSTGKAAVGSQWTRSTNEQSPVQSGGRSSAASLSSRSIQVCDLTYQHCVSIWFCHFWLNGAVFSDSDRLWDIVCLLFTPHVELSVIFPVILLDFCLPLTSQCNAAVLRVPTFWKIRECQGILS